MIDIGLIRFSAVQEISDEHIVNVKQSQTGDIEYIDVLLTDDPDFLAGIRYRNAPVEFSIFSPEMIRIFFKNPVKNDIEQIKQDLKIYFLSKNINNDYDLEFDVFPDVTEGQAAIIQLILKYILSRNTGIFETQNFSILNFPDYSNIPQTRTLVNEALTRLTKYIISQQNNTDEIIDNRLVSITATNFDFDERTGILSIDIAVEFTNNVEILKLAVQK